MFLKNEEEKTYFTPLNKNNNFMCKANSWVFPWIVNVRKGAKLRNIRSVEQIGSIFFSMKNKRVGFVLKLWISFMNFMVRN